MDVGRPLPDLHIDSDRVVDVDGGLEGRWKKATHLLGELDGVRGSACPPLLSTLKSFARANSGAR